MLQYDFEQSIGYWIMMTSRLWEKALAEELAPHGITYPQLQVLGWLALDGDLTQRELAERMRVEAPTLAGILDRMEKRGWVVRQTAPGDRRKKLVRPLPKVQPVWEQIVACARRVRSRAGRGLTPRELKLIPKLMAKVQDNLRAKPAQEAVG